MPEISRFYGIVIRMFFDDHPPAHFHAYYGSQEALIEIETLSVFAGKLPPRALGLVMEWAAIHQDDLRVAWTSAKALEPVQSIAPLK